MSLLLRVASKTFSLSRGLHTQSFSAQSLRWFQVKKPTVLQKLFTKPVGTLAGDAADGHKLVGKWLLCCSGMVFGAVILGGVTRLTESGLSMVNWKFLGEKMPSNNEEWLKEFENYKQYPEFKMKNSTLTVEEFKFIYMMEYIHRMWGRLIGISFAIPAVFFWKRGFFSASMKKRVILMGTLIGLQGLMGWYMVKSGLEDKFQNVNDVPRVSQYRLASHLAAAFTLYIITFSTALSYLLTPKHSSISIRRILSIQKSSHLTAALVFLTAISGAFVAGLDAGLVYNSFPKMADRWIPDDILNLKPIYKNITENPTTVQFNHRVLGITTLTVISILWLLTRQLNLPRRSRWAFNAVTAATWLQATLGISTLLTYVPVPLATAHQSGSLLLLSCLIWLIQELKFIKFIPK